MSIMLRQVANRLRSLAQASEARATVRGFFAAEGQRAAEEEVKVSGVSGTYAKALYSEAKKAGTLREVEADVKQLSTLLEQSTEFQAFLADPSIQSNEKTALIMDIVSSLKLNSLTENMVQVMADNGRLQAMESAMRDFEKILLGTKGEIKAIVTTFEPLTPAQRTEVSAVLKELAGSPAKMEVEERVDPFIMGGMVVELGDRFIDLSVRTRVRKIEQAIAATLA